MATSILITNEDVARGAISGATPLCVTFSEDGKRLYYSYPDKDNVRQLNMVSLDMDLESDLESAENPDLVSNRASSRLSPMQVTSSEEGSLSLEEKLRRERMRLFVRGIVSFQLLDAAGTRVLIPSSGALLLLTCDKGVGTSVGTSVGAGAGVASPALVYDGSVGEAMDAQASPNGTAVAFVIARDLYVLPLPSTSTSTSTSTSAPCPRRLTVEGEGVGVACGVADYLAQEEMDR